jgi:hypothetical protein
VERRRFFLINDRRATEYWITARPKNQQPQVSNFSMNIIRRTKREGDGHLNRLARWLLDNQTGKHCPQKKRSCRPRNSPLSTFLPGPLKHEALLTLNRTAFCFNLIAILAIAHIAIPIARPYTAKLFKLSYYNPNTGNYGIGHDDFYFIAFSNVLLTGLRAGCMQYLLAPLAKQLGISKKKEIVRFSEQVWMLMYYNVFWPLGMVTHALSHLALISCIHA